jgi:hypothetical protein
MHAQADDIKLQFNRTMRHEVILTLCSAAGLDQIDELHNYTAKGKTLDVKIEPHRNKRSLNANNMFWSKCGELAEKLNVSHSEVYERLLVEYGKAVDYVVLVPEAIERFSRRFRVVQEIGTCKLGDRDAIQLACYYGSSDYNTKEMSRLIDGIMYECKLQGIETASPSEIALMKTGWGK